MPDFETVKACAQCWSEQRLLERAKLWPDPLTWTWFFGERCDQYSRAECVDIFATGIAYIQRAKVTFPGKLGAFWSARMNGDKPQLLAAMAALGPYLDDWDEAGPPHAAEGEAFAELADAVEALIATPKSAE